MNVVVEVVGIVVVVVDMLVVNKDVVVGKLVVDEYVDVYPGY